MLQENAVAMFITEYKTGVDVFKIISTIDNEKKCEIESS